MIRDREEGEDVITGLKQKTYFGKPQWDGIFNKIAESNPRWKFSLLPCGDVERLEWLILCICCFDQNHLCLSACLLFVCLFLSVCLCLSVLSVCLFVCLSTCLPVCLSVYLLVCLSVYLLVCLFVSPSVFVIKCWLCYYFRSNIGVFFCGPPALSHTLHTMSNQHSNVKEDLKFYYNKENF